MSSGLVELSNCQHDKSQKRRRGRRRKKKKGAHGQQVHRSLSAETIDDHPTRLLLSEVQEDVNIGSELKSLIQSNNQLSWSIVDCIKRIHEEIEEVAIHAFIEHDRNDPSHKRIVLEINTELYSIEHYKEVKDKVRNIVRDLEPEKFMIYTRIKKID